MALLASCATGSGPNDGFAEQFEAELFSGSVLTYEASVTDALISCVRVNGLDDWIPEPAIGPVEIDPAPGLHGSERMRTIGSGTIASHPLLEASRQAMLRGGVPVPPPPDAAVDKVVNLGSIVTPSGASFSGGCKQWATETVRQSADFVAAEELAARYGAFVAERLDASPEVVELMAEWSNCMAKLGYPGLGRQGAQLDQIFEQLEQLKAGTVTYESALDFDIAISTAAAECNDRVDGELSSLRDALASEFAELGE